MNNKEKYWLYKLATTDRADLWDEDSGEFYPVHVPNIWEQVAGRDSEEIDIDKIWGGLETSPGFSEDRVGAADPSYPIILDDYTEGEGFYGGLVDGRHRRIKMKRDGKTRASVIKLTPEDIRELIDRQKAEAVEKKASAVDPSDAYAVYESTQGDPKHVFLRSQLTPEQISTLVVDDKDGTRKPGENYKGINILGDYYSHPTVKSEDGDNADIIVVDDEETARSQFDEYLMGGTRHLVDMKINSPKGINKEEIIRQLAELNHPGVGVAGGAAMVLRGLRDDTSDIDADASPEVFNELHTLHGSPETEVTGMGTRMYNVPGTHIDLHESAPSGEPMEGVVGSVSTPEELLPFYENLNRPKDQQWIKALRRHLKRKAVIIKGNPKFVEGSQKKLAEPFYNELKELLESKGYETSFDSGEPHTTPEAADLWVGHSRGQDRLRFAPEGTRTLAIDQYEDRAAERREENAKAMAAAGYANWKDYVESTGWAPPEEHYQVTDALRKALA